MIGFSRLLVDGVPSAFFASIENAKAAAADYLERMPEFPVTIEEVVSPGIVASYRYDHEVGRWQRVGVRHSPPERVRARPRSATREGSRGSSTRPARRPLGPAQLKVAAAAFELAHARLAGVTVDAGRLRSELASRILELVWRADVEVTPDVGPRRLAATATADVEAFFARRVSPGRRLRVLVAEDEYVLATEVADALKRMEIEPIGPTPSIGEAMDLVRARAVDAAILDLHLIDGDASVLADWLAERGIPIVVYSGFGRKFSPASGRACRHLAKPAPAEEAARMAVALAKSRGASRSASRRGDRT